MIKWSWMRCGNLFITVLGVTAIALLAFVLVDAILNA